jgi:hypothetical protein
VGLLVAADLDVPGRIPVEQAFSDSEVERGAQGGAQVPRAGERRAKPAAAAKPTVGLALEAASALRRRYELFVGRLVRLAYGGGKVGGLAAGRQRQPV